MAEEIHFKIKRQAGPDARIFVVARRGKISGVGHSTRLLIMGDPDADYGETVVRLNSSGPVEKFVEKTAGAIAITGVSSSIERTDTFRGIKRRNRYRRPSSTRTTTGASRRWPGSWEGGTITGDTSSGHSTTKTSSILQPDSCG